MKKNDFIQIKNLDIKELKDKAKVLRSDIAKNVLDKNMKKLKDLKQVSKKKKDLAQVLTIIRQKELLAELESNMESRKPDRKEDNTKTQKS